MKLFLSSLGPDASRLALTDDGHDGLRTWTLDQARDLFDLITTTDVRIQGWRSAFQPDGIRRIFDLAKQQGADVSPRTSFQGYNLSEAIHRTTGRSYHLAELLQANSRVPESTGDPGLDEIRQLQLVMAIFDEDLPLILPGRSQLGETTNLRFWPNGRFEPGSLSNA